MSGFMQGGGLPVVARGPEHRRCKWSAVSRPLRRKIRDLLNGARVEVLLDCGDVVQAHVRHPAVMSAPGQFSIWLRHGFSGSYAASRCRPPGYAWGRLGGERFDKAPIPLDRWQAEGDRRFGPDPLAWRVVCPCCGFVQSGADYKDAGAPSNAFAFSCVGRWKLDPRDAFGEGSGPCNYTGGGLFQLNPITVAFDDCEPLRAFAFASGVPHE